MFAPLVLPTRGLPVLVCVAALALGCGAGDEVAAQVTAEGPTGPAPAAEQARPVAHDGQADVLTANAGGNLEVHTNAIVLDFECQPPGSDG